MITLIASVMLTIAVQQPVVLPSYCPVANAATPSVVQFVHINCTKLG